MLGKAVKTVIGLFLGTSGTASPEAANLRDTYSTPSDSVANAGWTVDNPYVGGTTYTLCNNGTKPLEIEAIGFKDVVDNWTGEFGDIFPWNGYTLTSTPDGSRTARTITYTNGKPLIIEPSSCINGTVQYDNINPDYYAPIMQAPANFTVLLNGEAAPRPLLVDGILPGYTRPFPEGVGIDEFYGSWYSYWGDNGGSALQNQYYHRRFLSFVLNNAAGDLQFDTQAFSAVLPQWQMVQQQLNGTQEIHFSEGGWTGSSSFSAIFADPTIRAKHAANILKVCQQFGLKGWNIDWEYPGVGDAVNFKEGLLELQTLLSANGFKLSITLPGGTQRLDVLEQGCPGFYAALDAAGVFLMPMSYDQGDGLWMSEMGSISPWNDTAADGPGNSKVAIYNYLKTKGVNLGRSVGLGHEADTRILPVTAIGDNLGMGMPLDPSRPPISQWSSQPDGTVTLSCVAKALGYSDGVCLNSPSFKLPADMTFYPTGSIALFNISQTGAIVSKSQRYVGSIQDAIGAYNQVLWAMQQYNISNVFIWTGPDNGPAGSPFDIVGPSVAALNHTQYWPIVSPSARPTASPSQSSAPTLSASRTASSSASASASYHTANTFRPSAAPLPAPAGQPALPSQMAAIIGLFSGSAVLLIMGLACYCRPHCKKPERQLQDQYAYQELPDGPIN